MIKIRYRDADELSPGLHAAAVPQGRNTIIFLLPGLTAAERRAALRRLRLSARMGYCPPLPPAQLALALVADRIRTTVGQLGTLVRSHPAGSTVPVMVISAGAIAFLALSAVSIQVLHLPHHPARSSALAGTNGASARGIPTPSPSPAPPTTGGAISIGNTVAPYFSTTPPAPFTPRPRTSPRTDPSSSPGAVAPSIGPSFPTGVPTLADPDPEPSPTGSPAMRQPSPTPGSTCLQVGPLGVCP
ncbi:MAG: hypothetical protein ACRDOU_13350 [Streptosporangiaceae bacterium]